MEKLIYTSSFGTEYEVKFELDNYSNNGRLYVGLVCFDPEFEDWEPYGHITTNIDFPITHKETCGFVDINNMGEDIVKWLIDNQFARLSGNIGVSGFCEYPEMVFNIDKIKEYQYD